MNFSHKTNISNKTKLAVVGIIFPLVALAVGLPLAAAATGPTGNPSINLVNANFNSLNVGAGVADPWYTATFTGSAATKKGIYVKSEPGYSAATFINGLGATCTDLGTTCISADSNGYGVFGKSATLSGGYFWGKDAGVQGKALDSSGAGGKFFSSDSIYSSYLAGSSYAGYFSVNSGAQVYLGTPTEAIKATGNSVLNGNVTVSDAGTTNEGLKVSGRIRSGTNASTSKGGLWVSDKGFLGSQGDGKVGIKNGSDWKLSIDTDGTTTVNGYLTAVKGVGRFKVFSNSALVKKLSFGLASATCPSKQVLVSCGFYKADVPDLEIQYAQPDSSVKPKTCMAGGKNYSNSADYNITAIATCFNPNGVYYPL